MEVRRPRLDPSSHRCSRAFHGRVRFHDFCRSMFQRARQWTARASRTSGIRGRDGRRIDRASPFDRGRPLKVRRVRGRGAPSPRRSLPGLLSRVTLPRPRSLQAPRVAGIACRPVRRRRGRRAKPPAPGTLARHARREGRATLDLREEIGRSPARGAFHRKAVRKRGGLLDRREPLDRPFQRLFHCGEPGRGTLARDLAARHSIRRTANHSVID